MTGKKTTVDNNCSLLVQVTILNAKKSLHKYQHECSIHVLPCHDQGPKARKIEYTTAIAVKKQITQD